MYNLFLYDQEGESVGMLNRELSLIPGDYLFFRNKRYKVVDIRAIPFISYKVIVTEVDPITGQERK